MSNITDETQKLFKDLMAKRPLAEKYHQKYFGHAPPIISCIFNGRRMVALGSSLVPSDNPDRDWNTPSEFLSSHLKTTLGNKRFFLNFLSTLTPWMLTLTMVTQFHENARPCSPS